MPPKRSSTSEASTMSQAAIRKLVADSVVAALETQKATMAEADNSIREIHVAKRGSYKEFISCSFFHFTSIIHFKMTSLADKAILSGADNRPPMLEKDMYDSWKSIMELYMLNRQHGRMILESFENGPLL
uniref:Uncharacterized protein n=1 Tax=Tanacetum cinerariifolium TaxID=118510 RepID=A0A699J060_TANCI|nr:hypothetical protein [Tanacetum cinerariifolium]